MKLTIQEAMHVTPLKEAVVLAGQDNLDREIRNVNIVEVPDTVRWMRGGEILFSSGFAFSGDGQKGVTLLATLKSHDISALVLKPGPYMARVPREMICYAQKIGFPLLQVPENMPFNDCIDAISALLMGSKLVGLSVKPTFYFTERGHFVVSQQFKKICGLLAEKLGCSVLFLSEGGELVTSFEPGQVQNEEISETAFQQTLAHWQEGYELEPISLEGQIQGYLAVKREETFSTESQKSLLEYTAILAASEMQDEQRYMEQKRQQGSELLKALIVGDYGEPLTLERRCEMADFQPRESYIAFALTLVIDDSAPAEYGTTCRKYKEISDAITRKVQRRQANALITEVQELMVGLLSFPGKTQVEAAGKELLTELLSDFKRRELFPMIGISSQQKGVEAVADAVDQAREALKISIRLGQGNNPVSLSELGVYRLLAEWKDSKAMEEFCQEQLGPILEAEHGEELLNTLEDYYNNVCNLRKTSENLFLHKNSVKYRLLRINQLLGKDIMDPDVCMNLRLCMKYRHMK